MSGQIFNRFFLPVFMTSFLFLSSCTKEGPAGPQGPSGPAGPAGAQGSPGNSNTQSFVFNATPAAWQNGGGNWVYNIIIPSLTQDVIDRGSIEFYWMQDGLSTPMPFHIGTVDFMIYLGVGLVRIQVTQSGAYLNLNPSAGSAVAFKVLVTPAT